MANIVSNDHFPVLAEQAILSRLISLVIVLIGLGHQTDIPDFRKEVHGVENLVQTGANERANEDVIVLNDHYVWSFDTLKRIAQVLGEAVSLGSDQESSLETLGHLTIQFGPKSLEKLLITQGQFRSNFSRFLLTPLPSLVSIGDDDLRTEM
jgi:hypothetical protein